MNHERKCWDCGNIAEHESDITPGVLCKRCGSQDTRRTKKAKRTPTDAELIAAMNLVSEYITENLDECWQIDFSFSNGECSCELVNNHGDTIEVDSEYGVSGLRMMCERSKEPEDGSEVGTY